MSHYDIHDDEEFAEEFDIRRRQTAIAIKPELERDAAKLAMFDEVVGVLSCYIYPSVGFTPYTRNEAIRVLERARALQVKP